MDAPAICNGCGEASSAWDQLCEVCSRQIECQNCGNKYKCGQGLHEVNLCSSCLQEVFAEQDEERENEFYSSKPVKPAPEYEPDFGFDYQWELYEK